MTTDFPTLFYRINLTLSHLYGDYRKGDGVRIVEVGFGRVTVELDDGDDIGGYSATRVNLNLGGLQSDAFDELHSLASTPHVHVPELKVGFVRDIKAELTAYKEGVREAVRYEAAAIDAFNKFLRDDSIRSALEHERLADACIHTKKQRELAEDCLALYIEIVHTIKEKNDAIKEHDVKVAESKIINARTDEACVKFADFVLFR
jgi:hypothetical protein